MDNTHQREGTLSNQEVKVDEQEPTRRRESRIFSTWNAFKSTLMTNEKISDPNTSFENRKKQ